MLRRHATPTPATEPIWAKDPSIHELRRDAQQHMGAQREATQQIAYGDAERVGAEAFEGLVAQADTFRISDEELTDRYTDRVKTAIEDALADPDLTPEQQEQLEAMGWALNLTLSQQEQLALQRQLPQLLATPTENFTLAMRKARPFSNNPSMKDGIIAHLKSKTEIGISHAPYIAEAQTALDEVYDQADQLEVTGDFLNRLDIGRIAVRPEAKAGREARRQEIKDGKSAVATVPGIVEYITEQHDYDCADALEATRTSIEQTKQDLLNDNPEDERIGILEAEIEMVNETIKEIMAKPEPVDDTPTPDDDPSAAEPTPPTDPNAFYDMLIKELVRGHSSRFPWVILNKNDVTDTRPPSNAEEWVDAELQDVPADQQEAKLKKMARVMHHDADPAGKPLNEHDSAEAQRIINARREELIRERVKEEKEKNEK